MKKMSFIELEKFSDNRGNLYFPIKNNSFGNFSQCTVSVNKLNVFRGIHINNFSKLVTCVQGRVFDIIIDFNEDSIDYLKPQYFELSPNGYQLYIPANFGHAFLALEENSILIYHLEGQFTNENTRCINYMDPFIGIKLPIDNPILSEKDKIKNYIRPLDYVIFGSTGFLGTFTKNHLDLKDKNYITSSLRLNEFDKIRNFLEQYRPKYVINCAGITGTPNIFWCDENKEKTIETNITYQLTLAKICDDLGIHLTIYGSGGIFDSFGTYGENDRGNFFENFYTESRINLENILRGYKNLLYLRINYPISKIKSDKNLITKLLKYNKIDDVKMSVTYIDELIPIMFEMISRGEVGICNFTNRGVISLEEILNIYNEIFENKKEIIINTEKDNKRSFSMLKTEKLEKYEVMNIQDAVRDCLEGYSV